MRARAPPAPSDITGLTLQAAANRHDPTAAMAGQARNRPWLRPAHDLRRHFDLRGFAGETLPGPAVAAIAALLAGAGLLALAASAYGRAITPPVAHSVKLPGRIGGEA